MSMTTHRQSYRRFRLTVTVMTLTTPLVSPALVYSADPPQDGIDPTLLEQFHRLSEHMGQLDWDREYPIIERAMHDIWKRNGWTNEADRFARDLVCEVAAIPPTQPLKRLQVCNERVAQRYGLSEDQAVRFQRAMMREAAGMLVRNGGMILKQTREWMEARADGTPFTPQQVAEWTGESRPLILEMRNSVDRLAKELEPMLEPAKHRTLKLDLRSFDKRRRFMDRMTARWTEGKWRPEDWGLQDDPVHTTASHTGGASTFSAANPPAGKGRIKSDAIPRWIGHEPSTWFAYVLDFEKRFNLDAGQMSTAESIHAELLERANHFSKTRAESLQSVPTRQRGTHESYEPIRQLFLELKSRLDAIPTTSQRNRGEP